MWPVVPGIPICHDLTTWKHGGPTEDDPRQVTEGPTEHGPTWITQEENPTGAPTGQSIDRGSRTNRSSTVCESHESMQGSVGLGMTYDWSDTGDGLRVDPTGARPPEDVSPCRVQDVVLVLVGVVPCQDMFQILPAVLDCVSLRVACPIKHPRRWIVTERFPQISQNDYH